jgi:hypothetical protein
LRGTESSPRQKKRTKQASFHSHTRFEIQTERSTVPTDCRAAKHGLRPGAYVPATSAHGARGVRQFLECGSPLPLSTTARVTSPARLNHDTSPCQASDHRRSGARRFIAAARNRAVIRSFSIAPLPASRRVGRRKKTSPTSTAPAYLERSHRKRPWHCAPRTSSHQDIETAICRHGRQCRLQILRHDGPLQPWCACVTRGTVYRHPWLGERDVKCIQRAERE